MEKLRDEVTIHDRRHEAEGKQTRLSLAQELLRSGIGSLLPFGINVWITARLLLPMQNTEYKVALSTPGCLAPESVPRSPDDMYLTLYAACVEGFSVPAMTPDAS